MSFLSPEFCYIALIFYLVYWALKDFPTPQKTYLTASSYVFYATWSIQFTTILFLFSLWIWWAGEWIKKPTDIERYKKLKLTIVISLSLSLLIMTKYYEFLRNSIDAALMFGGVHYTLPFIDLVVPAGVSFFSFQAITYLVWQGQEIQEEFKHKTPLIEVLLYLAFWPTLFAGPIFRAKNFFSQLKGPDVGTAIYVEKAIYFILLGLFEKIVLANWLSTNFVDQVYAYPDSQNTVSVFSGIWAYALQIFFDFSAYTLIVTGLGFLLGYQIPINFKQPYLAINLQDFWKRWHISLSTFIRDYIYVPLGGNQQGFTKTQINIFIAMVLSGLWHGANTTFLIWGALHAVVVIISNINTRYTVLFLSEIHSRILTVVFISIAWVFFRADNLEIALGVLDHIRNVEGTFTQKHLFLLILSILFFYGSQRVEQIEKKVISWSSHYWGWKYFLVVTGIIFMIIEAGPNGVPAFIYYRF